MFYRLCGCETRWTPAPSNNRIWATGEDATELLVLTMLCYLYQRLWHSPEFVSCRRRRTTSFAPFNQNLERIENLALPLGDEPHYQSLRPGEAFYPQVLNSLAVRL